MKNLLRQKFSSLNLAVEGAVYLGHPLDAIALVHITSFFALFSCKSASHRHLGVIVFEVTWCFCACVYHALVNLPNSQTLLYRVNTRFCMQPNSIALLMCAMLPAPRYSSPFFSLWYDLWRETPPIHATTTLYSGVCTALSFELHWPTSAVADLRQRLMSDADGGRQLMRTTSL